MSPGITESCLTYQWVMSHSEKTCHVHDCRNVDFRFTFRFRGSCLSEISLSHVSYINESCLTYQREWCFLYARARHAALWTSAVLITCVCERERDVWEWEGEPLRTLHAVCVGVCVYVCVGQVGCYGIRCMFMCVNQVGCYGVATISRLLKIRGLFCRISSLL